MRGKSYKESQKGISLLEILLVVVIIGILTAVAVSSFRETNDKYRVESEIKEMFANLMDARAKALQRNRVFFVRIVPPTGLQSAGYETYEDTNPAPDGNGILDAAGPSSFADRETVRVRLVRTHTIEMTNLAGGSVGLETFRFFQNGVASVPSTGFIRIVSENTRTRPDYDCIVIGPTRVKMGQFSANGGICVER